MSQPSQGFQPHHLQSLSRLIGAANSNLQRFGMFDLKIKDGIESFKFNRQQCQWVLKAIHCIVLTLRRLQTDTSRIISLEKSIGLLTSENQSVIQSLKKQIGRLQTQNDQIHHKMKDKEQFYNENLKNELKSQKQKLIQESKKHADSLKYEWQRMSHNYQIQIDLLKEKINNKNKEKKPQTGSFTSKGCEFFQSNELLIRATSQVQKELSQTIQGGFDRLSSQNQLYQSRFVAVMVEVSKIEMQLYKKKYLNERHFASNPQALSLLNNQRLRQYCQSILGRLKTITNCLQNEKLEVRRDTVKEQRETISASKIHDLLHYCVSSRNKLFQGVQRICGVDQLSQATLPQLNRETLAMSEQRIATVDNLYAYITKKDRQIEQLERDLRNLKDEGMDDLLKV